MSWGDTFVGEFSMDLPNGRGVLKTAGGDEMKGMFKDGEPVGAGEVIARLCFSTSHLQGVIRFPNECIWRGGLISGRPHGKGTIEEPGGRVVVAIYDEVACLLSLSCNTSQGKLIA